MTLLVFPGITNVRNQTQRNYKVDRNQDTVKGYQRQKLALDTNDKHK